MTSRVLKTKFPCRECGEPAEVRRVRDAPHARCTRCAELAQLYTIIHHRDGAGAKHIAKAVKAGHEGRGSRAWLVEVLHACSEKLEAAALCLEAMEVALDMPTRRHLLRAATTRVTGARNTLGANVWHFDKAAAEMLDAAGFSVVEGGGEPCELPEEAPRAAVALSVVRGGGA